MAEKERKDLTDSKDSKSDREKKAELAKKLRYMRDKDREKVKGIFKFYEVPGGHIEFVFKAYEGDEVQTYTMFDNEMYTIPLGVAKHLNNNGWYPEYSFIPGEPGAATQGAFGPAFGGRGANVMKVGKKIRRFAFQSLEFMDIDNLSTVAAPQQELITIEQVV